MLTTLQHRSRATRRHVSTATATAPPTMPQGNTACEHLSGAEMQNSFGVRNSVPNVQAMSLYVYIRTSSTPTDPTSILAFRAQNRHITGMCSHISPGIFYMT